jgi:hypothetical protein
MIIEYKKPLFLKKKIVDTNILMDKNFTINIDFKVEEGYKKDDKIGFFGIPGRNFGISYDYKVKSFVFEYWTIDDKNESNFNCYLNSEITIDDINNGVLITLTYDGNNFTIYKNFEQVEKIEEEDKFVNDYYKEPLYFGCHNVDSLVKEHACFTEMDINHLSIFENITDIKKIKKYIKNVDEIYKNDDVKNTLFYFNFNKYTDKDTEIYDDINNICVLKQKNKSATVGFGLVKQKLDGVGCGFCLAKWTQVTMHLHNGTTHSCHHPEPHKIGLEEIKRNPTALHNTKFKKQARKQMLNNERPKECQYCWNVEDTTLNSFSDRVFKSSEPWSEPYFDEIKDSDWRDDYNPKYAEVSFSNTCNFKCAYCGPEYSSKWMEEINEFGPYDLSFQYNSIDRMNERNTKPYRHSDDNPYVNAFWEWFPDLYGTLDTFRITGGEPLLSKDTWKVLDYIIDSEEPNRNLKLSINTNLGIGDDLVDRLILKLEKIINEDRVKEIIIFTSCEGYGKQAEFTRYGLDFEKLIENIDKILTILNKVTIVVMSTFNVFSVFSYEKLIKKVYDLKLKHFNTERYWNSAIILDTSYLRHPPFMSFRILKNYITEDYFDRWIKFMKFNSTFRSINFHKMQQISDVGFSLQEIEKIIRLKEIFTHDHNLEDNSFDKDKKDFYNFIIEYDKRRNYKCEEYFPELIDFIDKIKKDNNI